MWLSGDAKFVLFKGLNVFQTRNLNMGHSGATSLFAVPFLDILQPVIAFASL